MKVIPRRLFCCLLVAGVCFATTEVGTAFGQKTEAPPSPNKPSTASSTPDSAAVPAAKEITSKSTGMKLALIPAGTFLMGSSAADVKAALQADSTFMEEYAKAEQPQHKVKISKPFYMGVYEVTQGEFEKVMGRNPSSFSKSGDEKEGVSGMPTSQFPVENVSWFDAIEFCNKLSVLDGLTPYYVLTVKERDADGSIESADFTVSRAASASGLSGYRLPTEAEWEYACRANSTTPFHFGSVLNGDKANVNGNSPFGTTTKGKFLERPTTVGSYVKNEFSLYDMHGNVFEWCFDVFDEKAYSSRSGTTVGPTVTSGSEARVLRGGCWDLNARDTRSAYRDSSSPSLRLNGLGFRVVR
ncbi:MAG: formylglycine-generating enzyme family protein [Planctomycetota bacterium]